MHAMTCPQVKMGEGIKDHKEGSTLSSWCMIQTCNLPINLRTVSVCFNLNTTQGTHSALVDPSDHLPEITLKHSSADPRAVLAIFPLASSEEVIQSPHSAKGILKKTQNAGLIFLFFPKPIFIPFQHIGKTAIRTVCSGLHKPSPFA